MRAYWHNRNLGKPMPLSDKEKEEMLRWALEMPAYFPQAVKMILETTAARNNLPVFFQNSCRKKAGFVVSERSLPSSNFHLEAGGQTFFRLRGRS